MKLNPSFIFIKVDTFKTSDVLEIKKFGLRQKVTLDGWNGRERERGGEGEREFEIKTVLSLKLNKKYTINLVVIWACYGSCVCLSEEHNVNFFFIWDFFDSSSLVISPFLMFHQPILRLSDFFWTFGCIG